MSVFDLGLMILQECFDTIFDRTSTNDQRPQILDVFGESIGKVANKQVIGLRHLWELTDSLTEAFRRNDDVEVRPKTLLPLLNLQPESDLQREIQDIIGELEIIKYVTRQQREVVFKYITKARRILSQPDQYSKSALVTFNKRAAKLKSDVGILMTELNDLIEAADRAAESVDDLIGLKQQASVVQAYQAIRQGDETVDQGKAIMLFTIMTIVFLPSSFITSLFGMNSLELTNANGGPQPGSVLPQIASFWPTTFLRQIVIMILVSGFIIFFTLFLAFNSFYRYLLACVYTYATYPFSLAKNKLFYHHWLSFFYRKIDKTVSDPSIVDLKDKLSRRRGRKIEKVQQDLRSKLYRRRLIAFEDEDAKQLGMDVV
ncbi:MAG: hypothetical protein M1822_004439 [Bathelium mastoideum]|nr:MAG: hypothetical protein M1822_004439 [Bathelium mastoideum]